MLISIIVPVYNADAFLSRCVDSMLNQSHRDLEIILVNDGSTDASAALCDRYAALDRRIKAYHQPNAGPSVARNAGLDFAKGKYVMFVDADDFVDTDIARDMVEPLEKSNAGLAVCTYMSHLFSNNKELANSSFQLQVDTLKVDQFLSLATLNKDDPQAVRARAHITGNIWGKLYVLEIIKKNSLRFNRELTRYEDILFNVSYINFIHEIRVLDKNLYHYCVYNDRTSLSDKVTKNKSAMLMTSFDSICDYFDKKCIDYIKYYYSYLFIGHIIRLFQEQSPFTFREAYCEVKKICKMKAYKDAMRYYQRPKGSSMLIPFFLKLRLFMFASITAKIRMVKAFVSKKPIRQWCFSSAPK